MVFFKLTIYLIAFNLLIKDQVVEILKLPELYKNW